ncbi:MAG: serine hydrolase [Candidatus Aminicenantales bacterium]
MKKSALSILFLGIVLLAVSPLSLSGQPSSLEGHWEGSIDIPGMKLEINIDFTRKPDGTWAGDISIPAQKASDLPLTRIHRTGNEVRFEIEGVPGQPSFKGAISGDGNTITGEFTQGGQTFRFTLKRKASPQDKARQALAGFDTLVREGLKSLNVPGVALAVVVGDKAILAEGYGFRDIEKSLPMTADTLLAIGSATKAFTTFTMGTLVDEGRLEWTAPVRNAIPWFRLYDLFSSQQITPQDLVTHRSGLPRHDLVWYNNTAATREELVRRLPHLKPTAGLREKFQYNNLMFLTAGYLIEVLTGQTWEEAVRTRVLQPLEMKRTNFSVLDSQKDPDHALPYREEKGTLQRIPFRNITNMGPAGSINSSAEEMSHWLIVHLNGGKYRGKSIARAQTIEDMHLAYMPTGGRPAITEITPADYGLGWFIDTYRGHRRVHHGGNIDGFSARVCLFPQDGLGFVALANKNGSVLPELLIRHAADRILGLEPKNWIEEAAKRKARGEEAEEKAEKKKETRRRPGTHPAHALAEYAGEYHHPGYGDVKVFLENGQLFFTYNGITTPLEHWHYETFNGQRAEDPTFQDMKLTFRTDVNGYVAALEAPFEPTLEPMRFTKKPDARLFDPAYLQKFVGEYMLVDQTVVVSLKGKTLTVALPGQPEYELVPGLGEEFTLKQVKIISIRFKVDAEGHVTAVEFIQPSGIFEAKRIK